jgi:tetratricopeptide (TPR) repeat protein
MSDSKNIQIAPAALGWRLWLAAFGALFVALVVYSLTLAGYLFPGSSTSLATQWMGMDAMKVPLHPIWGGLVKAFGDASFSASMGFRLNLLSMLCGTLSAGLLCGLVGYFVHQSTHNEDTIKLARGASLLAGTGASFAFVFSTAIWQSSTHLEHNMFDVFLAMAVFAMFIPAIHWPKAMPYCTAAIAIGCGIGLVESVIFLPLLPLCLLLVVVASVKTGRKFYLPMAIFIVLFPVCYIVMMNKVASSFLLLSEAKAAGVASYGDVYKGVWTAYAHEMRQWVTRPGWLYIFVLAVAPFIACAFASVRGLNNERTWSQYAFHAAMTICMILATATRLSPEGVMRPLGITPVATSVLAAMTCGYLLAYWYLLVRVPLPPVEFDKHAEIDAAIIVGRRLAPFAAGVFVLLLVLSAVVNAASYSRDRGSFADVCANAIIDRLGERKWIVTDGMIDDQLRAAAAARGRELNLICLHRDMDDAYLKELGELAREKGLSAGSADLSISIQLGVLSFLQDWFAGDTNVESKVAIFGVPDLWYMSERVPVPECLFFGGVKDVKSVDGAKAKAEFLSFWKEIDPILASGNRKGSRGIFEIEDPVDRMRMQMRRHVGFIANNLGVVLQDIGMDNDAFELYDLVLEKIDSDNICALFNEFEMVRSGVKVALPHKKDIERKLKAIVDDSNRRYRLWSLSRYYGYIRSPEIFARMGYEWARSGQTGNALAQVQRAINFVPPDRQTGLLNMMAAIYASGNQTKHSEAVYEKVLEKDENNHDALMGMMRLAMQSGDMEKAKGFLTKAVKTTSDNVATTSFDWALLHLMNNDLGAARMALQKVTDLQPKSLQAWALLSGVLLQEIDQAKDEAAKKAAFHELETVILPKMETIADSPRNYYLQMTRALVWMRKGKAHMKQARDALVVASRSRPDVLSVGDMILNIDIALDDGESAETHARQLLRQDRSNKLANYVMGSLRLRAGEYSTAETFLRLSVSAERPLAAAQNDLAEVLRRLQRPEEAEKFARDATKTDPNLYVAWETLGSALLDQKKNLDEAETCVNQAIKLSKSDKNQIEDVRMYITLARVQLAKGDEQSRAQARSTIKKIQKRQAELSKYDLGEFEKLQKAVQVKK